MNYIKKLTAISAIIAILLTNSISFAANTAINGSTAAAGAAGAIDDTITVTNAGEFPDGDEIASATITNLDGTAAGTTTLTVGGDNANDNTSVLTVATENLTDNTSYIIAFTTVSGDFGTTTVRIGTPTNDTLTVTATVQPILKFGLESTNEALGTLTDTFNGGVTTGVEIGTNAVSGVSVTASSSNSGLFSNTANHTIQSGKVGIYSNEDYIFTSTALDEATNDDSEGATISGLDQTSITNTTPVTVYATDKPQNYSTVAYDTAFNVDARIAESTPTASDYTDVIIFTATANF